jgi:DNA-binding transcriptional regulator YhcF (GntR family)
MRPTLLKSFLISLIFWFVVTTLWWSFQRPEVNLAALARIKAILPFLPFEVPATAGILQSLSVQKLVLTYWTLPVLLCVVLSGLTGYGIAWMRARKEDKTRSDREKGTGNYRGVTLTLGELPMPVGFPKDDIDLGSDSTGMLARMTGPEKALLEDILGTISAHPNAYPGEGISISLLEHTLNIASMALTSTKRPGLSAIVAAGFELGKITAFKQKDDGSWSQLKRQDIEASKILGTLNSWYQLPAQDKTAVMLAVKYHTTPKLLPEPEGDTVVYRLAKELLTTADDTTAEVVVQEKQKTIEKTLSTSSKDLPDIIFDAFLQSLPLLSFQNRGLPKGVQAVAWKVGTRVYMLEIKLRETITSKIPLEVRGALTPNPKDRARLQPFTMELLKALHSRGWLVTNIKDTKVDPREALWNVKAGKLEFKGVIVIDVPPEYMSQLPSDDSMYEIAVTGALFNAVGGTSISKQDLMGSVLRPSAEKPPLEV